MSSEQDILCLGIDLGTTSVKTCLINVDSGHILHSISQLSHADVPSTLEGKGAEQNPNIILHALKKCIESIELYQKKMIKAVCVTGQMHGVMMWTKQSLKDSFGGEFETLRGDNSNVKTSNLYTWQDQRCSSEFLTSLPKPDSHLPLAAGHGCATLLWLNKHNPDLLGGYDCSGTVMDYLVAGLCGLDKPVTTVQLAASWGYFNTREISWNYSQLSECGLHIDLLPYVVCPGHKAGTIQHDWCGIGAGTVVFAALGDVQCAVYSVIKSPKDAVLNMSTSCQLAFSVEKEESVPLKADSTCPVQYFPYFDETYLAIAASLNGGNVLAHFVTMIHQWMHAFGCCITEEKIWSTLLDVSKNTGSHDIKVIPTLYGERHKPEQTASVMGINKDNLDIGTIFRSTCSGLLDNLSSMMPVSFLKDNGITNLIGSGSLLSRNDVMRQEVMKHYGILTIEFGNSCDSATGAALYAIKRCKL